MSPSISIRSPQTPRMTTSVVWTFLNHAPLRLTFSNVEPDRSSLRKSTMQRASHPPPTPVAPMPYRRCRL
jgi:hypothetical protein